MRIVRWNWVLPVLLLPTLLFFYNNCGKAQSQTLRMKLQGVATGNPLNPDLPPGGSGTPVVPTPPPTHCENEYALETSDHSTVLHLSSNTDQWGKPEDLKSRHGYYSKIIVNSSDACRTPASRSGGD